MLTKGIPTARKRYEDTVKEVSTYIRKTGHKPDTVAFVPALVGMVTLWSHGKSSIKMAVPAEPYRLKLWIASSYQLIWQALLSVLPDVYKVDGTGTAPVETAVLTPSTVVTWLQPGPQTKSSPLERAVKLWVKLFLGTRWASVLRRCLSKMFAMAPFLLVTVNMTYQWKQLTSWPSWTIQTNQWRHASVRGCHTAHIACRFVEQSFDCRS